MGNQPPQIKNRPLTSGKILVVGKGIYNVQLPPASTLSKQMVQAMNEGAPRYIRLQCYLTDYGKFLSTNNRSITMYHY